MGHAVGLAVDHAVLSVSTEVQERADCRSVLAVHGRRRTLRPSRYTARDNLPWATRCAESDGFESGDVLLGSFTAVCTSQRHLVLVISTLVLVLLYATARLVYTYEYSCPYINTNVAVQAKQYGVRHSSTQRFSGAAVHQSAVQRPYGTHHAQAQHSKQQAACSESQLGNRQSAIDRRRKTKNDGILRK